MDLSELAANLEKSRQQAAEAARRTGASIQAIGPTLDAALRRYIQAGVQAVSGNLTEADRNHALAAASEAANALVLLHAEFISTIAALDRSISLANEMATITATVVDPRNPPTLH
jgi:hypothetical protein